MTFSNLPSPAEALKRTPQAIRRASRRREIGYPLFGLMPRRNHREA
jgi:hypothetical protein